MIEREQVSAEVAAQLLGVRKETVYAYVSRGVLDRTYATDRDGRRVSLLRLRQVRELAAHRHRPHTGRFELVLDTSVSALDPRGGLAYRGHDAVDLAERASFEQAAELLWQTGSTEPWSPDEHGEDRALRVADAAPPDASPADRARICLSLVAAERPTDDEPYSAARAAVVACARSLAPTPTPWAGTVSATVAQALTTERVQPSTVDLVRRALVLLADHELATSTVAARAAAGTSAALPVTLLAGAAALGGPLHGLASSAAERTLDRWLDLREVENTPGGFGHLIYTDLDPRAESLLDAVLAAHPDLEQPVTELRLAVLRRDGLHPNVDLALAVLVHAVRMRAGSGEAIFLIARLAGFTAHAVEERDQPLRFRPRAIYTGESTDTVGDGPT